MSATVIPFRSAPARAEPPRGYSQGWCDGARYVERWGAWRWRIQGAVAGLLFAIAVAVALLYYFGGSQ